jgi:hypothetical protein
MDKKYKEYEGTINNTRDVMRFAMEMAAKIRAKQKKKSDCFDFGNVTVIIDKRSQYKG